MKVYLAGPINGTNDDEARTWRDDFKMNAPEHDYLDPMVRDYRGREDECVTEIVELDKADINAADVVLAYCWQPSWGTAMELHYAAERGKRIVVVVPHGTQISPWLRYHATVVVNSLAVAKWHLREV